MLTIDGSEGEGGGQVLRTSLALSMVTGTPFRMTQVRAKRAKPGLLRQHLTALRAAAEVSGAEVTGAELGSQAISFHPGTIRGGAYHFAVGTAGSATLVLQTVLPALLRADAPSSLILEGGTHNPLAPPVDFLVRAFLPLLARMGPRVTATLVRPGFFPAGGGKLEVAIAPAPRLEPLELLERGALRSLRGRALVASVGNHVAERELAVLAERLQLPPESLRPESLANGPGNVVFVEVESEHVTEVFSGFGERGVSAETVAGRVADEALAHLRSEVPVGEHLADQLLVPLALAGRGAFRTVAPSSHTRTQVDVIGRFLPVAIGTTQVGPLAWQVDVGPR
jgi:RNA 3'-terminal phosphate cyclase (ATP)